MFISHDANRAGAQIMILDIARELKNRGHEISFLILSAFGPLLKEFKSEFTTFAWPDENLTIKDKIGSIIGRNKFKKFISQNLKPLNIDLIYANTIASGEVPALLKSHLKIPVIAHIHELAYSISHYSTPNKTNSLLKTADKIIACSPSVAKNLNLSHEVPADKLATIPSFIQNNEIEKLISHSNRHQIRVDFHIPEQKFVVVGVGNAEWRKGVDLFLDIVEYTANQESKDKFQFVWVGIDKKSDYFVELDKQSKNKNLNRFITWIEPTPFAKEIINASDVFFLSSREDPFPLVMLEAALMQKPLISFKNTGGGSDFIENEFGFLVDMDRPEEIIGAFLQLQNDPILTQKMGKAARQKLLQNYGFKKSIDEIELLIYETLNVSR